MYKLYKIQKKYAGVRGLVNIGLINLAADPLFQQNTIHIDDSNKKCKITQNSCLL